MNPWARQTAGLGTAPAPLPHGEPARGWASAWGSAQPRSLQPGQGPSLGPHPTQVPQLPGEGSWPCMAPVAPQLRPSLEPRAEPQACSQRSPRPTPGFPGAPRPSRQA